MSNFWGALHFSEIYLHISKKLSENCLTNSQMSSILLAYSIKRVILLRGRAVVACQAHNLKVDGSIPSPATNEIQELTKCKFLFLRSNSGSCSRNALVFHAAFVVLNDPLLMSKTGKSTAFCVQSVCKMCAKFPP